MNGKKKSIFAHMNWLDWLLAAAFTGVFGFIGSLMLPVYGCPLGILAAVALLYLAKVRRDAASEAAEKETPPEDKK